MSSIEKYIDNKIGLIKIFNSNNISEIDPVETTLGDTTLIPNTKTTLNDFFNQEVVYLGIHEDYLQFKIGEEVDLFGDKIYTNEFKKINDHRIMTIYQVGTARDYNFKKGIWK